MLALSSKINERDAEILETLSLRVRTLSVEQVARTWWPEVTDPVRAARSGLRRLEVLGKVHCYSLIAHPELDLHQPLVAWSPRDPIPDFEKLAYQCVNRWTEPVRPCPAIVASATTGCEYGGWGGRFPRPSEQTHDLHLATVFLLKRGVDPELPKYWRSEELIRLRRAAKGHNGPDKLPDAMVTRPKRMAIDFAGRYSATRLESFHDFCADQGLRYELW